jgi:hypothetical protein
MIERGETLKIDFIGIFQLYYFHLGATRQLYTVCLSGLTHILDVVFCLPTMCEQMGVRPIG